jgi:hypothetical protein
VRRFLAWLSWLLPLAVLGLAVLFHAAIDRAPLVRRGTAISPLAVEQARALFRTNDPRGLRQGEQRTVTVPLSLLDEGVNHLASRGLHGYGAFVLDKDAGEIQLSIPVPWLAGSLYLNLRAAIGGSRDGVHIARAAIGDLPLPPALVEAAIEQAICRAGYCHEWRLGRGAIRRVEVVPASKAITVTYVWAAEILDRARSIALPGADVARLREAQEQLGAQLDRGSTGAPVTLFTVLQPLLAVYGDDQRDRRRAALLVMAAYLAGKDLAAVAPQARDWRRLRTIELTLRGRDDTAQHFVVSAALAAWADEPVADAIGLYKELDDARQGSGFSFADLAADRAGTRFGELLMRNASRLDDALRRPLAESELMPEQGGLPEYLHEPEFRRRFGGTDSAEFRRMSDEITRRLDALPLYR